MDRDVVHCPPLALPARAHACRSLTHSVTICSRGYWPWVLHGIGDGLILVALALMPAACVLLVDWTALASCTAHAQGQPACPETVQDMITLQKVTALLAWIQGQGRGGTSVLQFLLYLATVGYALVGTGYALCTISTGLYVATGPGVDMACLYSELGYERTGCRHEGRAREATVLCTDSQGVTTAQQVRLSPHGLPYASQPTFSAEGTLLKQHERDILYASFPVVIDRLKCCIAALHMDACRHASWRNEQVGYIAGLVLPVHQTQGQTVVDEVRLAPVFAQVLMAVANRPVPHGPQLPVRPSTASTSRTQDAGQSSSEGMQSGRWHRTELITYAEVCARLTRTENMVNNLVQSRALPLAISVTIPVMNPLVLIVKLAWPVLYTVTVLVRALIWLADRTMPAHHIPVHHSATAQEGLPMRRNASYTAISTIADDEQDSTSTGSAASTSTVPQPPLLSIRGPPVFTMPPVEQQATRTVQVGAGTQSAVLQAALAALRQERRLMHWVPVTVPFPWSSATTWMLHKMIVHPRVILDHTHTRLQTQLAKENGEDEAAAYVRRQLLTTGILGLAILPVSFPLSVLYHAAQAYGALLAGSGGFGTAGLSPARHAAVASQALLVSAAHSATAADFTSGRQWSSYSRVLFRRPNEVSGTLSVRLRQAGKRADTFLALVPAPITTSLATVARVLLATCLLPLAALAIVNEQALLYTQLGGRPLLTIGLLLLAPLQWFKGLSKGGLNVSQLARDNAGEQATEALNSLAHLTSPVWPVVQEGKKSYYQLQLRRDKKQCRAGDTLLKLDAKVEQGVHPAVAARDVERLYRPAWQHVLVEVAGVVCAPILALCWALSHDHAAPRTIANYIRYNTASTPVLGLITIDSCLVYQRQVKDERQAEQEQEEGQAGGTSQSEGHQQQSVHPNAGEMQEDAQRENEDGEAEDAESRPLLPSRSHGRHPLYGAVVGHA